MQTFNESLLTNKNYCCINLHRDFMKKFKYIAYISRNRTYNITKYTTFI